MTPSSQWGQAAMATLARWGDAVVASLPGLAATAGLLVGGWLLARLLRAGTVRLARTVNRGLAGLGHRRPLAAGAGPEILGAAVFWLTVLAVITAAAQVLALDSFGVWLGRLAAQLPNLLTGGLILAVGFFLSVVARNLASAAVPAGLPQRALVGRVLQGAILVTALVLGADQMGLDVTFLVTLGTVVAGALAGGLALAVSLGAGPFVRNLLGTQQLRQHFREGQRVRMGGYEGRIVAFTSVALVLDCPQGRVYLPGATFLEAAVELAGEHEDG